MAKAKLKVIHWARGREFSRHCPHCGARIRTARWLGLSMPWVHKEIVRTFECGTDQCLGHDKKLKLQRWTEQSEQCLYNEIAFWRERYTTLRIKEKHK